MLANYDSHTMIAAQDLARAQGFYTNTLGLSAIEQVQGLFVFKGPSGGRFCLFASPLAGTAKNAVMGWEVDDIVAVVTDLRIRGVIIEDYDVPGFQTVNGIVSTPLGRSAWFKDSEGNMLGLTQWN